jgi:hypothetical protein
MTITRSGGGRDEATVEWCDRFCFGSGIVLRGCERGLAEFTRDGWKDIRRDFPDFIPPPIPQKFVPEKMRVRFLQVRSGPLRYRSNTSGIIDAAA